MPLKSYRYTKGKTPGNYEQKCHSKSICYTDENANTFLGNPAPNKYVAVKLEVIKSKSFKWDHTKKTKEIGIRLSKIAKDDKPSPSSYKTELAFRTTQYEKNFKFTTLGKEKTKPHAEIVSDRKKYIPGPGAHKGFETAWEKASKSPTLRKGRH